MGTIEMSDDRLTKFDSPNFSGDGADTLQRRIEAYIRGVRGIRKNPVSEKEIIAYFCATDPEFVREQLSKTLDGDNIRIVRRSLSSGRRHNGAYGYVHVDTEKLTKED